MRPFHLLVCSLTLAACSLGTSTSPTASLAPDLRPLLVIAIQPEDTSLPFVRDDWPHWNHVTGTCHDIRASVLIVASQGPTTLRYAPSGSCTIDSGLWVCPYTGDTLRDADSLQIDHLIPLHEAHLSGGATWDATRKRAYANDTTGTYHLLAVEGSINGTKSDHDPTEWQPSTPFRCTYLATWATIKARWNLAMDSAEYRTTRHGLDSCAESGTQGMPQI